VLAVLVLALLSGCVHYERPGSTDAHYRVEYEECWEQAKDAQPRPPRVRPADQQVGMLIAHVFIAFAGFASPEASGLSGISGYPDVPDTALAARHRETSLCMDRRGWTPKPWQGGL
jgi:hypothetical protein